MYGLAIHKSFIGLNNIEANTVELGRLDSQLKNKGFSCVIFENKARFTILGVHTINVPNKATLSPIALISWINQRIEYFTKKELTF